MKDGTEENEFDKLKDAIAKVEDEITRALATDEGGLAKWNEALLAPKNRLTKGIGIFRVCGNIAANSLLRRAIHNANGAPEIPIGVFANAQV